MASNKKMSAFITSVNLLNDSFVIVLTKGGGGSLDNGKITVEDFRDVMNQLNGMTDAIYDQLENIGVQTISATQWGHLSVADQDVGSTHNVTFASVDSDLVDGSAAVTQTPGDNSTKVATTEYVDAAVPAGLLWSRTVGTPNYLLPATAVDDIGSTVFRITRGWFSNIEITDMPTVGGTSINANGVLFLTSAEVTQLANIDTTTISISQWGNVGAMDQDVATTDAVTFLSVTASGGDVSSSVTATDGSLTIENASSVEKVKLDANGHSWLTGGAFGIGTVTPATSALLELSSTTGALLTTRMTTAQMNALTRVNGMVGYDTDEGSLQAVHAGAWSPLITANGNIPLDANWNIGSTAIVGDAPMISTVATGTTPMTVDSQTKVDNLNADFVDGFHLNQVFTNNVSNPPTDAELDTIFGTPATVGTGFTAYIDDNGAGTNFYQSVSDGTNWWTFTATKAV